MASPSDPAVKIAMTPSKTARKLAPLAFCLSLLLLCASPWAFGDSLRSQLENLAKENHLLIEGLDRLGPEESKLVEGDLTERIKLLLSDYNFMSVGEGKKIEKLTILSAKQHNPRPQNSGLVKTQRMGSHHQVPAVLSGPNNTEIRSQLLVDTGATTLVLPESLMGALGFDPSTLQTGMSQTAGGTISTKIGVLNSVKVGNVIAEQVTVSFIPDQKLSGARLLGMSFLSRFRFSLDDGSNELLLQSK